MKHEVKRISGGEREGGWIQPVCSCGWEGSKHYAYNDYQHSNAKENAERHIHATAKRCAETADEAKKAEDPTVNVAGKIRKEFGV